MDKCFHIPSKNPVYICIKRKNNPVFEASEFPSWSLIIPWFGFINILTINEFSCITLSVREESLDEWTLNYTDNREVWLECYYAIFPNISSNNPIFQVEGTWTKYDFVCENIS